VEAFFLPAAGGQRFCLLHRPPVAQAVRAALVYLHPFGEEMNNSRRIVAAQARSFATAGFAVLQIDLYGCGDSSGDFGEVSWADWRADVHLACACLQQEFKVPLWLWGLRAGALLAAEVAAGRDDVAALLLWQPVWNGEQLLRQLLRLKLAAGVLGGDAGQSAKVLRQQLAAGHALEIAGYPLMPVFAAELEALRWPEGMAPCKIACLELAAGDASALSPVFAGQQQAWLAAGHAVRVELVASPAFWQTPGVSVGPGLNEASRAALEWLA